MSKEIKDTGKKKKLIVAAVGLCLGVGMLLYGSLGTSTAPTEDTDEIGATESYRLQVEATLTALCGSVRGAGRVEVFVTLSGGYEYIYATDERGECVTVGSGSNERAVVKSVRAPEIRGVGIVCSGARDPAVAAALTDLVTATLGIGSNRVFITVGGS